jgi:excisionase family DNA binding protein
MSQRRSVSTPAHTSAPIPASTTVSSEPLWTRDEAANYLRIRPATIYQLTRRRSRHPLPYLPCGKFMRFRRSEIDKWLEDSRAGAA